MYLKINYLPSRINMVRLKVTPGLSSLLTLFICFQNFQMNSDVLNVGSVGYTQVSPMKNIQFVNQKKKFFANNQHHKQSEFIYGSNVQARGGYGNEAVSY